MEDDLTPVDEKEPLVATPMTSRRSLLKGAGVAAGGLAALGALGAVGAATASAAGATPGPDVPYPGAPDLSAFLRANGSAISGDDNRGDGQSFRCVYYEQKSSSAYNVASGAASGKRQYQPIVIRKPVDSSTPILHRALVQNQTIDGAFKFYRNNDGGDFNYYTITIKQGRIIGIDEYSPDNQSSSGVQGLGQPMEEVSISFNSIQWAFGEISFTDNVHGKF